MSKYRQEVEGPDGWSRWVQPVRRGYKMACCDCGLVHTMNFRIHKGRVQFQAQRNVRSTAQKRRHMKKDAGVKL